MSYGICLYGGASGKRETGARDWQAHPRASKGCQWPQCTAMIRRARGLLAVPSLVTQSLGIFAMLRDVAVCLTSTGTSSAGRGKNEQTGQEPRADNELSYPAGLALS